jgi:ribosomal protein L11 methylase PrmA
VHGRTFQNFKDAEYWGPNDDKQNNALDLQSVNKLLGMDRRVSNLYASHHMTLILHDNKLHLAPLENPQTVLDVGTGTGIWAM